MNASVAAEYPCIEKMFYSFGDEGYTGKVAALLISQLRAAGTVSYCRCGHLGILDRAKFVYHLQIIISYPNHSIPVDMKLPKPLHS